MTDAKCKDLIHELEVHRLELEMQNQELRSTREKLDESLARYSDLFELAPVAYLVLRADSHVIDANFKMSALLSVERNKLLHKPLNEFVAYEYQDAFLRHLRMTFKHQIIQTAEVELIRADGTRFLAQVESIVQQMGNDSGLQCLSVCTDVTDRRRQEAIIQRQANYDTLTDVPNRSLFLDRLAYTILLAERERTHFAIFFLDLDNFKGINDSYGHAVGDEVLIETARRLQICARKNDTVARLSGDEFCMLLPRVMSTASADRVARKVMAVMEQPFQLSCGNELDIACSIGVALYPKDGTNNEILLNNADMALYQAKKAGRRQFVFFSKIMDEEVIRRQHKLGFDLKNAILHDQFILHYQPIIDLQHANPYGVEVLVRWQHPEYGLLFPGEFIALSESNGMIVELGEWVLRAAAKQIHAWHEAGIKLSAIWVNLSTRQCGNADRVSRLRVILDELMTNWRQSARLGLEITESEVLELSGSTSNMFEAFRQHGIFLSVDDFGTGYSSLKRLLHLPIDFIKVDKSFVSDIAESEKSINLVKAIIALGHSIGTRIVAEGIETPEQYRILQNLGCELGQGFYFARPMGENEFVQFMESYPDYIGK
ncbi:MAG: putative bifunctional diguanylate cyclase/phosphodiesterase [Gammaproteobacteria bacterium]